VAENTSDSRLKEIRPSSGLYEYLLRSSQITTDRHVLFNHILSCIAPPFQPASSTMDDDVYEEILSNTANFDGEGETHLLELSAGKVCAQYNGTVLDRSICPA